MSNRDKLWLIFILVITFLFSCRNVNKELIAKVKLAKDVSINASKGQYYSVYNGANDSLKTWIQFQLPTGLVTNLWKVDSLLCFNKAGNRCIMAVLVKCVQSKDCVQDELHFLNGTKIMGQWYFFLGATVILPRELYQNDIHTPLSFEKMHEIAMDNIFRGYLIKDNGQWHINDKFFISMANKNASSPGYGPCRDCQSDEEYYLYLTKENWLSKFTPLQKNEVTISYYKESKKLKLHFPLRSFSNHIRPFKVVAKMYKKGGTKNPAINYIQSITNFEETGSVGEIVFEKIDTDDVVTFDIRVYFTTVPGDRNPKSLTVTIPIKDLLIQSKISDHK